jgi:ribosomal protein S18 acetylase RimI-like enzyme
MDITPLDSDRDGDALLSLYAAYTRELERFVEPYRAVMNTPRAWWVGDADALVHLVRVGEQLAGFVINGWRKHVDRDTDSEVLELYVAPAFRRCGCGRQLAQVGISHLTGRAGLQVYLDNGPAQRFWPAVLERRGVTYRTYGALDGLVPVLKYRFQVGA